LCIIAGRVLKFQTAAGLSKILPAPAAMLHKHTFATDIINVHRRSDACQCFYKTTLFMVHQLLPGDDGDSTFASQMKASYNGKSLRIDKKIFHIYFMSLLTRKNSNTHQFSQTFLECVIYGT
jgi:hypothetical protein